MILDQAELCFVTGPYGRRLVFLLILGWQNEVDTAGEDPRHIGRLCDTTEALHAALPAHWTIHAPSHVMRANGIMPRRQLADGYSIAVEQSGAVTAIRIVTDTGILAASGYGAETDGVVVYDRTVTETEHRRNGLGHFLMQTLHEARRNPTIVELLVATDDGRAFYETLGWGKIVSYASASIAMT
jgi:GNAT superfamily N-acetyltransferase